MKSLAREVLRRLEEVAQAAKNGLAQGQALAQDVLANINSLTSTQATKRLNQIDQQNRATYEALAIEPAIARVAVRRQSGEKTAYYFCRSEQGLAGVFSYKTPIGRLASLPVGEEFTVSTPGGRMVVEVVERAILRPESTRGVWDSRDTVVQDEHHADRTIRSLRALLGEVVEPEQIEDLLSQVLAEASREANIVEGVRRGVIAKMQLRDQPVLDQYQDEIFRLPLNRRLLLLGPPGTGKTTTLIHRLGQKLNALDEDERRMAEAASASSGVAHHDSWLMFTPTELLKQYLKEAFAREHVPASDLRIQTWQDYRRELATEAFPVLRTAGGSGTFVLRELQTLQPDAITRPIQWFKDFDEWQRLTFLAELRDSAASLAKESRPEVQRLGVRFSQALERADRESIGAVLSSLVREAQQAQALVTEMRTATDGRIRATLNLQLNRNKQFLDDLARLLDDLQKSAVGEGDDQEDLESEDEEEAVPARTGPSAAANAFIIATRAQARAAAAKRSLGKSTRNARIVEWLGDRSLAVAVRAEVGSSLLLQSAIRRFINPVKRYVEQMPRRYRAFRRLRQEEKAWYMKQGFEARDIHPLEVDVVLLAMLRAADGLIARPNALREIDTPSWSSLKPFLAFYRNQVFVDEATDFSPIQLACMSTVAHPQLRSFFACGDFNQRLTVWGARTTDDVKWVNPDVEIRSVSIAYRQSRQLNELARGIVRAVGGTDQEVTLPERVDAEGVPPALAESAPNVSDVVNWLAMRILEVARFLGRLPSTAIFVNSESDVEPLAEQLNAALADHNVQVVPCVQGRVRGQDSDVRVFHVEHIKGLEFEVVFFVGVDRLAKLHPDLFDKYLYVGITRAATYLGITCDVALPAQIEVLRPMFVPNWSESK